MLLCVKSGGLDPNLATPDPHPSDFRYLPSYPTPTHLDLLCCYIITIMIPHTYTLHPGCIPGINSDATWRILERLAHDLGKVRQLPGSQNVGVSMPDTYHIV